jgi:hypothetical protein
MGIDPRPVLPPERLAELSAAHILTTDTNDLGVLHPLLRMLTERLGRRLRLAGLVARRLRLEVGYADHTDSARAVPLGASPLDADLWDASRKAFALANHKRIAVRGMTVSLERVEEASAQLGLWDGLDGETDGGGTAERRNGGTLGRIADPVSRPSLLDPTAVPPSRRSTALQTALDRIYSRYGTRGVTRGAGLATHPAESFPMGAG